MYTRANLKGIGSIIVKIIAVIVIVTIQRPMKKTRMDFFLT